MSWYDPPRPVTPFGERLVGWILGLIVFAVALQVIVIWIAEHAGWIILGLAIWGMFWMVGRWNQQRWR